MDIESIRILNEVIRDKIEEILIIINGWIVGDWYEYIEKKVLEELWFDIEEVNKIIIGYLLEFLGISFIIF